VQHVSTVLRSRRCAAIALAIATTTCAVFAGTAPAGAAIVPTVGLGTSSSYSVLAGTTVTNTGASTLNLNLGLAPGTSITGFPPGVAAGSTDIANPVAAQAQVDLTAAYVDAAGRPLDATTTADLTNLILVGGVYAGPAKGPLSLSGPLVLDGEGNTSSVFIFQTDSSLTTASASSVSLINGAQACNVFWQVGSSATLGSSSTFRGTILALTSITVNNSVTVEGRALARNGAVTLDTDVFQVSPCTGPSPSPSPTTTTPSTSTTSTTRRTTTTTRPPTTTTSADVDGLSTTTTAAGGGGATTSSTIVSAGLVATTTVPPSGISTQGELPRTGASVGVLFWSAIAAIAIGSGTLWAARRPDVPTC
jgi:hypothetical protein